MQYQHGVAFARAWHYHIKSPIGREWGESGERWVLGPILTIGAVLVLPMPTDRDPSMRPGPPM